MLKMNVGERSIGVLVAVDSGQATPYALQHVEERGTMFVGPTTPIYEGMIVGEHCKEGDLEVNVQREKKLSNMRAAGSDRNMKIAPAQKMSLEEALEYIDDDEYVETTPHFVRLRKKYLNELERKRMRYAKAKEDGTYIENK